MQRHRIFGFITCSCTPLVYVYTSIVHEASYVVITTVGEMMFPRFGETVNAGDGDHLPCLHCCAKIHMQETSQLAQGKMLARRGYQGKGNAHARPPCAEVVAWFSRTVFGL